MRYRNWVIGAGLAAMGAAMVSGPAQAAAYIKFDGVDGESKVADMRFSGGVNVAAGDFNGDGQVDSRDFEVWRTTFGAGASAGASAGAAGTLAARPGEPQAIGLLLPAVQKVREAAAARPAGMACEVGATLRNLTIRNEDTAQMVRVPEATITACSAEQISLNFTKVEAMRPGPRRMMRRERE